MKVLVINCGSSSLKFQLVDSVTEEALAKGICERIGIDGRLVYKVDSKKLKETLDIPMEDHKDAIKAVLDSLTNSEYGVIKELSEIDAVGHRVVHGAEKFADSFLITDEIIAAIEECNDLAPLHNPANLIGIRACQTLMGDVKQVAVFDTAFHQTMPEDAYLYAIPYKYYEKYKIRKYGFHGTSHSYVSKRIAELLDRPIEGMKTIVCHLGNGASVTAVESGKSVDTSMGLTPLEGLVMGTRSGDIDPTVLQYISKIENISIEEVIDMLNKESGMLGVSGYTSDFRDIWDGVDAGKPEAIRALNVFIRRVVKYVGAYAAEMNGVDALVFTAGVGENDYGVREMVCEHLTFLGVELDYKLNDKMKGKEMEISTPESKVKVWCVPTEEELMIARETVKILK